MRPEDSVRPIAPTTSANHFFVVTNLFVLPAYRVFVNEFICSFPYARRISTSPNEQIRYCEEVNEEVDTGSIEMRRIYAR